MLKITNVVLNELVVDDVLHVQLECPGSGYVTWKRTQSTRKKDCPIDLAIIAFLLDWNLKGVMRWNWLLAQF